MNTILSAITDRGYSNSIVVQSTSANDIGAVDELLKNDEFYDKFFTKTNENVINFDKATGDLSKNICESIKKFIRGNLRKFYRISFSPSSRYQICCFSIIPDGDDTNEPTTMMDFIVWISPDAKKTFISYDGKQIRTKTIDGHSHYRNMNNVPSWLSKKYPFKGVYEIDSLKGDSYYYSRRVNRDGMAEVNLDKLDINFIKKMLTKISERKLEDNKTVAKKNADLKRRAGILEDIPSEMAQNVFEHVTEYLKGFVPTFEELNEKIAELTNATLEPREEFEHRCDVQKSIKNGGDIYFRTSFRVPTLVGLASHKYALGNSWRYNLGDSDTFQFNLVYNTKEKAWTLTCNPDFYHYSSNEFCDESNVILRDYREKYNNLYNDINGKTFTDSDDVTETLSEVFKLIAAAKAFDGLRHVRNYINEIETHRMFFKNIKAIV